MQKHFLCALFCLFLCFTQFVFAEYPEIRGLSNNDAVFKQLSEDIESYYRLSASLNAGVASSGSAIGANSGVKKLPEVMFYSYTIVKETDLFSLAARFSLPYETLATLNRLDGLAPVPKGFSLIIPSQPGLFIPLIPESDLESLMTAYRIDPLEKNVSRAEEDEAQSASILNTILTVKVRKKDIKFYFFSGARFHPFERAYFLDAAFRFPLPKGRLTSSFGTRASPFSGKSEKHNGIDLAAPIGTSVFAARDGTVVFSGFSDVYGNYVIVSHEQLWETVYGHLSKINVQLRQKIKGGFILGEVGTSGMSTGPHLHFEVRNSGVPKNPESYIPRGAQ